MTASGTVFDRTAIFDFAQSDGGDSLDDYVIHKDNENCIAGLHTARGNDAADGPWNDLRYFFAKNSDCPAPYIRPSIFVTHLMLSP